MYNPIKITPRSDEIVLGIASAHHREFMRCSTDTGREGVLLRVAKEIFDANYKGRRSEPSLEGMFKRDLRLVLENYGISQDVSYVVTQTDNVISYRVKFEVPDFHDAASAYLHDVFRVPDVSCSEPKLKLERTDAPWRD
jgi:hypothetical protein